METMEFGSPINLLVWIFWFLGIFILSLGLFVNYGEEYLPQAVSQLFRYGRANITAKTKLNYLRGLELPKSWFAHFYLYSVIIQSYICYQTSSTYFSNYGNLADPNSTSVLSTILLLIGGRNRVETISSTTTVLVTFLFLVQVSRRLYESWFVSVFSGTKMNVLHYVAAFVHYSGSMLSLIAHSPSYSGSVTPVKGLDISWTDWTALHSFGMALFLYGSVEQHRAHVGLANLRKKDNAVVSYSHQVPRGGLFELVSCPNYFAEILIYFAIAMICGFQNPSWNAVTIWVICNQAMAAVINHIWYTRTFPNYPKERKAVFPYIY